MSKKVLLTSVCRPMGPKYGDASSVGYELLYGQVTRAQGLFSPRTFNIHYSLEYIAENLDAPTVVLQYPSKAELIREALRQSVGHTRPRIRAIGVGEGPGDVSSDVDAALERTGYGRS